jgi:hypothetical protein
MNGSSTKTETVFENLFRPDFLSADGLEPQIYQAMPAGIHNFPFLVALGTPVFIFTEPSNQPY